MVLDKRAFIMELVEIGPNCFGWEKSKQIWVNIKQDNKTNLFSRIGIGGKTVIIHLRKTKGLTLNNAIMINNRIMFLTDILEAETLLYKVLAVDIPPKSFTAETDITSGENELKEPSMESQKTIEFPAVMTEKYLKYDQQSPMVETEKSYVLATHKLINLSEADLVSVAGTDTHYVVQKCHNLDEFHNEYEITRRWDN